MTVTYKDLTPHEKELINRIIPRMHDSYVDFHNETRNDDFKLRGNAEHHANYHEIEVRLTSFLTENGFLKPVAGETVFAKTPAGDTLKKLGTIDKYYTYLERKTQMEKEKSEHQNEIEIEEHSEKHSHGIIDHLLHRDSRTPSQHESEEEPRKKRWGLF